MKSYIIANPGKGLEAWRLTERPDPTPGPGEVLIRVKAAALNYRDWMIASGAYRVPSKSEAIPLSDGAGEIVALGAGVRKWKVGDRVCGSFFQRWRGGPISADVQTYSLGGPMDGMLAEFAVLSEDGAVRIPSHLSYEEAATLPCAALTAWNALMEAGPRLQPGASVLILGTGGVSIFAGQFARAAGFRVIATSSSHEKIARLRQLGFSETINYKENPEWQNEVVRLTHGEGVDHVIEVGGSGTLPRSLESVKAGGTVSLIGLLTGLDGINPGPVLVKAVRFQGVVVGSVEMFEAMNRAIDAHGIKPVIDRVYPFDQAVQALAQLKSGSHFGKLVVKF